MTQGTVLRAADRQARPWKNGGGVTREIAVGGLLPDGSFDWRVSMADVTVPGAFSRFEGIDRTLCVLAGRLSIDAEGYPAALLDPSSDPFSFPGDVAAHGAPLDGTVHDLNVMTRRGGWRAEVRRRSSAGSIEPAPIMLILATGPATVGDRELGAFDAYLLQDSESGIDFASAFPLHSIRIAAIAR